MTAVTETGVTTQVYRTYIKASPAKIWEAITSPEWTERYLYGSLVEYDLRPGGSYSARPGETVKKIGEAMGQPIPDPMVDGEVIEADPPHKLVQTWRMLMDPTMMAEGFSRLTWEIEPVDATCTKLTVVHELESAPVTFTLVSGDMEGSGAGGGWNEILDGLKTLLETGEPLRLPPLDV
jgi:uncharacterized protein YndB with AHSA1/START domain